MPNLQELLKHAQVEWKTLGEVCNISADGDVPKHSFLKERNNEHSVPIISNGTAENAIYGYTAKAQITMPAVTISARGTIGYIEYRDYPYYPIVRLLSLIPKQDSQLSAKYLYYCLSKKEFLTPTSAIRQLTIPMVKKEKIPIPSLEVQAEIVRILDTFAELTVELTAELTLRKKQYRYYLEKLLSEEYLRECSEKVGEEVRVVKLARFKCAREF